MVSPGGQIKLNPKQFLMVCVSKLEIIKALFPLSEICWEDKWQPGKWQADSIFPCVQTVIVCLSAVYMLA